MEWTPFHYGVCYYPEAWPENRWADDIRRMKDAGFNVVRMGEGAWSYWEPEEGKFQFELFDRIIDLCKKAGIKVILGTPTYAAPAWVSHQYPEVLRKDFNRIPMKHGGRRNLNYTSKKYMDLSDKLCTALAEHYKREKQIIAWQLDNEFNCHMEVSYAESDTIAFQAWCRKKYKSLDELNRAWGASFWSQTYTAWEQIDLPHPTAAYMNPHCILDESRFISDTVVDFAKRQAAILRKANPKWQITHNGLFTNVNPTKVIEPLDFWSHDHYPLFWPDGHYWSFGTKLLETRAMSEPFAILEQQSGPGGQMSYLQRTPRAGEMRQWAWQSIAHGARMFLYFRWRTCPFGSEQHWHGLLEPDNRDTRRLAEAAQVGEEIRSLPKAFFESPVTKAVGILREYDNEANSRRINTYNKQGQWEQHYWCSEFQKLHVPTNIAWETTDFSAYKLLIAPHLCIIDTALAKKLTAFVKAGGTLVLGAQTGTMTTDLHLIDQPAPGVLAKLAGVEVEEWTTLPEDQSRSAQFADGEAIPLNVVVERLKLTGAEPLAWWTGEDTLLDDTPAITINLVGKGRVIYVGGYVIDPNFTSLAKRWMALAEITPIATANQPVEIVERRSGKKRFIAMLNYGKTEEDVTNLPGGKELLTGAKVAGAFTVPPLGVAIVESQS